MAAVLVIGSLVGSAAAWWRGPPPLLAVNSPTVEVQDSAMQQYWYAYDLNTEAAWLAVEANFPQDDPVNRVYALKAKQRLAELYRAKGYSEQAMTLYRDLAGLEDQEPQLAAKGLIGQVNLLADQNDGEGVSAKLARAVPLIETFTPDQQREVLMLLDPAARPLADPVLRERLESLPLDDYPDTGQP